MPREIAPATLAHLLDSGSALALIDVREHGEYNAAHIAGASSSASIVGTWCCTSTFSPKSLLGTFMPHSVVRFWLAHRLTPPSSTATRR